MPWFEKTLPRIERLIAVHPAKTIFTRFLPPDRLLSRRPTTTLIVTGVETDVCVLASVLGAVDRGFRTIIAADAVCSSADETHDAMLAFYSTRFSEQIELAETAEILENWTARE